MMNRLLITIEPDGSMKIDASQMAGTPEQIEAMLRKLAEKVGNPDSLIIEGHKPGHVHTHDQLGDGLNLTAGLD